MYANAPCLQAGDCHAHRKELLLVCCSSRRCGLRFATSRGDLPGRGAARIFDMRRRDATRNRERRHAAGCRLHDSKLACSATKHQLRLGSLLACCAFMLGMQHTHSTRIDGRAAKLLAECSGEWRHTLARSACANAASLAPSARSCWHAPARRSALAHGVCYDTCSDVCSHACFDTCSDAPTKRRKQTGNPRRKELCVRVRREFN